jgi:hypothetical protein
MKTGIKQVKEIITLYLKENKLNYCEFKMNLNAEQNDVFGTVYMEDRQPPIERDILDELLGDDYDDE